MQATASAAQGTGPAEYSRFHTAVARAQLINWLAELTPRREVNGGSPPWRGNGARGTGGREALPQEVWGPGGLAQFLIDISGPGAAATEAAARVGHRVLRVIDPGTPAPPAPGCDVTGHLGTIAADSSSLEFLADGCADGVIAEDRTLSRQLAAEALAGEIARVLRPGGQVLACVDSLNLGMAVLAEQHRWLHLIDVPNADVVLVPWPDGTITRCYGAEQLCELFTGSGLEVRWIRPRTVFSPQTVSYLLARDPGSFGRLVSAELSARCDDSVGAQLIICAEKRC